jgi:TolB-like protein
VTEEPQQGDGPSVWDRLRRRKVVQWSIAYVAAGWGLLQGLAYVGAAFDWPEQLQRFAIVAFVIGLPVAIVVAWYHGDRGHQTVGGHEFAILTALLLAGGGLFWWVGRMPVTTNAPAASAKAQAPAPVDTGTSIAVLPFVNMSPEADNEFFSDGISEELLNVLVRVPGLGVASRTSSFGYKGSELGTVAIAQALKVNHVLEGSVRKSGNQVRITAQLIDAVHDRHLWSATYDRELTDIFAIQEEIANAIVDALHDQLGVMPSSAAVTVKADTENLEAYQVYLKARELFIARRDLPESIRLFEQVTQMDPNFARGWEGLAAVASVAPSWGIRDRDYRSISFRAARRALELDPTLSMPWAVLGNLARGTWPANYAESLVLLDRAVSADPKNASAYLWRGISWLELGFFERAIADFDRCLALEPGYLNAERHKALALLYLGKTDAAIELYEQGVAAGFTFTLAENFIAPLVQHGDRLSALLLMQDMGLGMATRSLVLKALTEPGKPAASPETIARVIADEALNEKPAQSPVSAHLYLWLGDIERAGQTDDGGSGEYAIWDRYPTALRNSPGFKRKIERSGILAYWQKHGYPPQCRPLGTQDFTCD